MSKYIYIYIYIYIYDVVAKNIQVCKQIVTMVIIILHREDFVNKIELHNEKINNYIIYCIMKNFFKLIN